MTDTTDPLRVTMDFTAAGRLRLALWQGKPRQADSHVDIHLHASVNQVRGFSGKTQQALCHILLAQVVICDGVYNSQRKPPYDK